jgi:osmoprotectant transport system substrate-binding protein
MTMAGRPPTPTLYLEAVRHLEPVEGVRTGGNSNSRSKLNPALAYALVQARRACASSERGSDRLPAARRRDQPPGRGPGLFLPSFSYETLCTPTRRLFLVGIAASTLARASAEARPVVVGSKLDLEGGLLGHMMLLALAEAKIAAENRLRIGPTSIVRAALLSGAIDLCPEYTGNAAFFFHEEGDPAWKDAAAGYARAATLDYERNHLVWLTPAPADNSWVIAVRESLARIQNLRTMVDFARFVREGNNVKLAASAEFVESAAGLPAFEAAYGFRLAARQLLILSGGETSATMKAAADGISGVNATMAYGTDGALKALDLHALEDTRRAEPVYAPAPVIREATLTTYPEIRDILSPVFAHLDLASLRDLNEKVAVEGSDPGTVAREFFRAQGLFR